MRLAVYVHSSRPANSYRRQTRATANQDTTLRASWRLPGSAGAAILRRMRMPLHVRILLGAVIGAAAGVLAKTLWGRLPGIPGTEAHDALHWIIEYVTKPIGAIFLRLLLMLVAPLMFAA